MHGSDFDELAFFRAISASGARALLIGAEAERQLPPAEVNAYLDTPISDAEREDLLALNRWFTARYPSGAERLAYVRRAYLRWTDAPSPPGGQP